MSCAPTHSICMNLKRRFVAIKPSYFSLVLSGVSYRAGGCSVVGRWSHALCSAHHGVGVPIDHFGLAQWWQSLLALLIFHLIYGHFFHPVWFFFSFYPCSWRPVWFEVLWLTENTEWRLLVGSSGCCIPEASVGATMASVSLTACPSGPVSLYIS